MKKLKEKLIDWLCERFSLTRKTKVLHSDTFLKQINYPYPKITPLRSRCKIRTSNLVNIHEFFRFPERRSERDIAVIKHAIQYGICEIKKSLADTLVNDDTIKVVYDMVTGEASVCFSIGIADDESYSKINVLNNEIEYKQ